MNLRTWALCLLAAVTLLGLEAQEQEHSTAQPSQDRPTGTQENKPPTGEPAAPPNGAENPGMPDQVREMLRGFLALGAPPDPAAVARGQKTFVATCGFCHGTTATGGAQGPNLVRSTMVLHDQGTGKEIAAVIHNGRPEKGMPPFPNLGESQVHDIAQFLLGRTQAAANRMEYTIQNIVTGDPRVGQAYFQSHCAECHSPSGDLAHIATRFDPVALEGRFLYPANNPYGMFPPPDPRALKHVTVTLPSGKVFTGTLTHIDDFSVGLRDEGGEQRSWVYEDVPGIQVEVHDPLAQHLKLLRQYSDADMHNILAYLETLK
ncbi:c-type cytochrome [Acidobacteria bacterium AB60]|nr:c-type cytochrome [Acidobacteria bacterium AB60]